MTVKFLLYLVVSLAVIWSIDSVNINNIFKKNKVYQARLFYLFLTLSLTYLLTNFIYDIFLTSNF